jgi:hypothetical protein
VVSRSVTKALGCFRLLTINWNVNMHTTAEVCSRLLLLLLLLLLLVVCHVYGCLCLHRMLASGVQGGLWGLQGPMSTHAPIPSRCPLHSPLTLALLVRVQSGSYQATFLPHLCVQPEM